MAQNAAGDAGMGGKDLSGEANGDWLADIFDAVEDGVITGLEMDGDLALPEDAIAALQPENGGAGKPSDAKKRGAADEPTGLGVDAKHKKSRREKLRRDALNDRFMDLSALLDTESGKPLKTDKASIVTDAAMVIKTLREELAKLSASLEDMTKTSKEMTKERESLMADKAALLQDKAKLEQQLHCFMSSMPFASPMVAPAGPYPPAPQAGAMVPIGAVNGSTKPGQAGMMPVMWSFPQLVIQSTTAEEDAKLRAPVA